MTDKQIDRATLADDLHFIFGAGFGFVGSLLLLFVVLAYAFTR